MDIIIIEDETLAAERLESILSEVAPDFNVVAKTKSIKESVKWFLQNKADLIFLDIQLSDGLSFSIFDQIEVNTPVIFTTAYDQYAIKAFQLNSVDYLLKPVRKSELEESIRKYRNLKSVYNIDFEAILSTIQGKKPEFKKRFLIQYGERIKKIETEEIAYFYALEKSVFLKTFDGHSYPLDQSLDKLELVVDPEKFFRINRKFVVNINSITGMVAYSRGRVKLELVPQPEVEGPVVVSIERASDFKVWMDS
jgi:DNA-binding LytR/AlgR family response regulator